jgi:hypothetical protein
MTDPVAWPDTLPQRPNANGFSGELAHNEELFTPDSGFVRGRRRAESQPDALSWSFDLTRVQYLAFRTFWREDLGGGHAPIVFTDPVSGDPITLKPVGPARWQRLHPQVWRITLQLGEI